MKSSISTPVVKAEFFSWTDDAKEDLIWVLQFRIQDRVLPVDLEPAASVAENLAICQNHNDDQGNNDPGTGYNGCTGRNGRVRYTSRLGNSDKCPIEISDGEAENNWVGEFFKSMIDLSFIWPSNRTTSLFLESSDPKEPGMSFLCREAPE